MADKDKKIDPYDVEALEKSLNDSATRVSTIWVSFLIFSLYLLIAAATVTHRQLFLAEPVKLPVLNIDLPLWGFFFLAPILFVILHAYVLIQVILLSRTAAAYSAAVGKAVERDKLSPEENAALRQRLANTLFAQIFAGSPREREGGFGKILNFMAWITLAVSPILILLTFQFMFLPYHSHGVTWTHRALILLEFAVAFQLWPLVLNPQRDFHWPNWRAGFRTTGARVSGLLSAEGRARAWHGIRRQTIPLGAGLLFALLSLWLASFPGEWHVNLLTGRPRDAVQCERWLHRDFGYIADFGRVDLRVDRLSLPGVDIVDDEKLEKIEAATRRTGEPPFQGERTRSLRFRDLNCSDFGNYADLRRVDLSGSSLRNAHLQAAKLHGSSLIGARLQGAVLRAAQLPGASLNAAQLQGAILDFAQLQGASALGARLQGASLLAAKLQGAILDSALLQSASLESAQLQGASLKNAQLQGAFLDSALLQGALLVGAQLQGASLNGAQLQGALFAQDGILAWAELYGTWIWRTRGAPCTNARVVDPKPDAVLDAFAREPVPAGSAEAGKLVAWWLSGLPDGERKDALSRHLQEVLTVGPANNTAAPADPWLECAKTSSMVSQRDFDEQRVSFLRGLVCDDRPNGAAVGAGIFATMSLRLLPEAKAKLARALLGEDGKECAAAKSYDEETNKELRAFAGPPPRISK